MTKFDSFAEFRMTGHSAIVTGGAQNIGEAIARSFAGAGAKVLIADLKGEKAAETAKKIAGETGGEALGIGCDVTKKADSMPALRKRWRSSAASRPSSTTSAGAVPMKTRLQ